VRRFKKAIVERARGGELPHHLGDPLWKIRASPRPVMTEPPKIRADPRKSASRHYRAQIRGDPPPGGVGNDPRRSA
jgi:hypothetical protein